MFITASKLTLPSEPFGLSNGFYSLKLGDEVTSRWDFRHDGVKIPAGTRMAIVEKSDNYVRVELTLPELN